jgi:hypothetical protein
MTHYNTLRSLNLPRSCISTRWRLLLLLRSRIGCRQLLSKALSKFGQSCM